MTDGKRSPQGEVLSRLLSGAGVRLRAVADGDAAAPRPCAAHQPPPGAAGKYDLDREIARGGIGVIMEGRDEELGRRVAVKLLQEQHRDDPNILRRFIEEAQIGGQLQHPGIVPVYELGVAGGSPFFAMKLIRGRTLTELLAERGEVARDRHRFLAIFEAVCQTMAYAHARGVIHRDLKPDNVMVGQFGEVQVVDWGLAKVLDQAQPPATPLQAAGDETCPDDGRSLDGTILGTPAYMSPEQARGEVDGLDERSDVFGLGAILCEILTGAPPHQGPTSEALLRAAHGDVTATRERLLACDAETELVALAQDCLDPDAAARPESAQAVAERISRYRSGVEQRAQQAMLDAAEARVRARATVMLSAAAVLIVLIAGGGWLYIRSEAERRSDLANARVEESLRKSGQAAASARAAGWQQLDLWDRAVELAEGAAADASNDDVGESRRRRAEQELSELRRDHRDAVATAAIRARERDMLAKLERARLPADESFALNTWEAAEARRLSAAYRELFQQYAEGVDIATTDPEDAAKLLAGDIDVELAVAIDLWRLAWLRANQAGAEHPRAAIRTLREVADRLDAADSWRGALRAAGSDQVADREVLLDLAAQTRVTELSVASATLLAESLDVAGGKEHALRIYREAHRRHAGDFGMTYRIAVLFGTQGAWPEATTYFRAAYSLRPRSIEPRHMLGVALINCGRHREAAQVFEELLQERPGDLHFEFHLAASRLQLGEVEEAGRMLERIVLEQPQNAQAVALQGLLARRRGDTGSMFELWRRSIRMQPEQVELRALLGLECYRAGEFERAVEHLRVAVERDPRQAPWLDALFELLLQLDRQDELVQVMRAREGRGVISPYARCLYGKALLRRGQLPEAIEQFRAVLDSGAESAEAHWGLAAAYRTLDEPDKELEHLRLAASADQHLMTASHDLVRALLATGRTEEALARARVVLADPASKAPILDALARLLHHHGDHELAAQLLERAIRVGVSSPARAALRLGNIYRELHDFAAAEQALRRALEADPGFSAARANLALLLKQAGRLYESLRALDEGLERDPDDLDLLDMRARFLAWAGETEPALRDLEAVEAASAAGRAAELLAPLRATIEQLKPRRRVRELVEGADYDADADTILAAADLARELGDYARSVELYRRAAALHPAAFHSPWPGRAARAALRSATGGDRARELRRQALDWLKMELASKDPSQMSDRAGWVSTGDFDAVRADRLALLTAAEQVEWQQLWRDFAAALR